MVRAPRQVACRGQGRRHGNAVAHEEFEEGGLFEFDDANGQTAQIFVYRPLGASLFQSSVAYRVPRDLVEKHREHWRFRAPGQWHNLADEDNLQRLASQKDVSQLSGFDTFWYNWVSVHANTIVLR